MILSIETSTAVCSAAISENGTCFESRLNNEGVNHARMLPLFVDELLNAAKAQGKKLNAVALSMGPGSYTGLRIGTSTAKGLCYGQDVPLLTIDTLQVLCASVVAQHPEVKNMLLCPMLDARRMEVYTACYRVNEQGEFIRQNEISALIVNEDSFAAELAESKVCFFGDGAAKCKTVINHDNAVFVDDIVPDAKYMGILAEQALAKGEKADVAYFAPFYLKEFQAAPSHVKGLN